MRPRVIRVARGAFFRRRRKEPREAGAQRAGDEGDDAGEASLTDANAEEEPVKREAERDWGPHVHRLEGSREGGGVHESDEEAQRCPQYRCTRRDREGQGRESEVRSLALVE